MLYYMMLLLSLHARGALTQTETQETDTNKDTTDETFLRDAYG